MLSAARWHLVDLVKVQTIEILSCAFVIRLHLLLSLRAVLGLELLPAATMGQGNVWIIVILVVFVCSRFSFLLAF